LPVAVQLNHTIVRSHQKRQAAQFLARILGLRDPVPFGHFWCVELDNGVSLDFDDAEGEIAPQHYAFLVSEEAFDAIFRRVQEEGVPYSAYPGGRGAGEINTRDGGRGFYFRDPSGHSMEVLTRPYGLRAQG